MLFVISHSLGEKNGKEIGKILNIAVRDVKVLQLFHKLLVRIHSFIKNSSFDSGNAPLFKTSK